MDWSETGLRAQGFDGFVPFAELGRTKPPTSHGVYVVYRVSSAPPEFLETSVAGWFKDQDPSDPLATLAEEWVDGANVMYLGMAGGARGLRQRLSEYRRFGEGKPVGHRGGRHIWQLADSGRLLVGWKALDPLTSGEVEAQLIEAFVEDHGKRPFANRAEGAARGR